MSNLTPDDQELLRGARLGLQPTRKDHARIKRRVLAQVGLGVGVATSAVSTATAASAGTAVGVGVTVTKVVCVLVVAGSLVGTGVIALRDPPSSSTATQRNRGVPTVASPRVDDSTPRRGTTVPAPPPSPPEEAARAPGPAAAVATASPSPAGVAAPHLVIATAPPTVEGRPPAPPEPTPATAAPEPQSAPPPGPATVAAEAELLRRADVALHAGDPARALALLNEHAARFPDGVLHEERSAERIDVLCALGRRTEAREGAAAFLRDHARSPLAVRVRGSCAAP